MGGIRLRAFRIGVLCVLAAACASVPPEPAQRELDRHRQIWTERAVDAYSFVLQVQCFCPEDYRRPGRVTVRRGAIESVLDLETGEALASKPYRSIDALFERLQRAIDDPGYVVVRARYDAEFGYPVEFQVEAWGEAIIADLGATYNVRDFMPLEAP